jgi:hypothetical protein
VEEADEDAAEAVETVITTTMIATIMSPLLLVLDPAAATVAIFPLV